MQWLMLAVGCVLFGQVPGDTPLPSDAPGQPPAVLRSNAESEPAAEDAGHPTGLPTPAAAPAVTTDAKRPGTNTPKILPSEMEPPAAPPSRHRMTPPEMVAEAVVLPPGSRLTGRPLTLLTALSSTADPRRQLEVTHAYWQLTEAVAVYHFSLDYDRQLREFQPGAGQAPLLRTARASSAALVREAEVAAVAAQHELAALAMLPPGAALPLPADRPHAGSYRTRFDQLFSMRTAPGRTRLIDRTLPIRRQAIDGRAAAAEAAADALAAALEAHRADEADPSTVLACMEELLRQRGAFIRSVCRYNHEIADYAVAVLRPGSNAQTLIGMLIHPAAEVVRPLVSGAEGQMEAATYNQRVPTPARRPSQHVPTPARRPSPGEPTPAPPGLLPGTSNQQVPTPATRWFPSRQPGKDQPTVAPPKEETDSSQPASSEPPLPPAEPTPAVEPAPAEPTPNTVRTGKKTSWGLSRFSRSENGTVPLRTPEVIPLRVLNKPVVEVRDEFRAPALYPALVDAAPDIRTRQLTLTWYGNRTLSEGAGEPISLGDCLGHSSGGDRRRLIAAYWLAGQRAAERQVLVEQAELLYGLATFAQDEERPSELRLRGAKLSSEAAVIEAHADLLEAQFELATLLGRETDAAWPTPSTPPRSSPWLVRRDAQRGRSAESWSTRRLAAMIPGLADCLQQRATAVIEADAARAEPDDFLAPGRSVEPLLARIHRQTEETLAFLGTLTDYNSAIGEYALTVFPPETPGDELADVLLAAQ